MKAISKAAVGALVTASLLGGGTAIAVAATATPAAAAHPAPQAATMVEYAMMAY